MDEIICASCYRELPEQTQICPHCGGIINWDGEAKSIIDRIEPNCLIHRYDGSDLLEAAVLIKEAKTNCKVATKLKEYSHPISVPKNKIFQFDDKVLASVQALRNERSATMYRYDHQIKAHWNKLKPY